MRGAYLLLGLRETAFLLPMIAYDGCAMSSSSNRRSGNFVFSTQFGELCGDCNQPVAACRCRKPGDGPADGIVRVRRETSGRKGKVVTVVEGVPLVGAELKALAKLLKTKCATGGKLAGSNIELQGEHRDRVMTLLEPRGWPLKRVGG